MRRHENPLNPPPSMERTKCASKHLVNFDNRTWVPGRGSSTLTVRFFQVLVMTVVVHITQERLKIPLLTVGGKLVGTMAEMEFALMQLLKGHDPTITRITVLTDTTMPKVVKGDIQTFRSISY
jgi:hypothetical protein